MFLNNRLSSYELYKRVNAYVFCKAFILFRMIGGTVQSALEIRVGSPSHM